MALGTKHLQRPQARWASTHHSPEHLCFVCYLRPDLSQRMEQVSVLDQHCVCLLKVWAAPAAVQPKWSESKGQWHCLAPCHKMSLGPLACTPFLPTPCIGSLPPVLRPPPPTHRDEWRLDSSQSGGMPFSSFQQTCFREAVNHRIQTLLVLSA